MKTGILKEVDVKTLKIDIPVRYEEDMLNDFPLRVKAEDLDTSMCERWQHYNDYDRWQASIDLDSWTIIDWPEGKTGEFYMKVCDEGFYTLLDGSGAVVLSIEEDYAPNGLIPPNDGFGDYVWLKIDGTGKIENWYDCPDFSDFPELAETEDD
ncbi:MAG: hypothetical protein LBP50_08455 [Tannerella sp.]|jgi:hypothetical protein|nr:hypothetical protein [Tannerella sp.]